MEKVAMELTEEQFRYLRLLDGLQEDEKYTAADLAERTGDKERNVRRYLGSLVEEGGSKLYTAFGSKVTF